MKNSIFKKITFVFLKENKTFIVMLMIGKNISLKDEQDLYNTVINGLQLPEGILKTKTVNKQ